MTTFERLFGPPPSQSHAAGLSSNQYAISRDRYSPVRRANTHEPQGGYPSEQSFQQRTRPYADFDVRSFPNPLAGMSGTQPSSRPIYASSDTASHMKTMRQVNPLSPSYKLPGCSSPTLPDATESMSPTRRPLSRSLDCSDITGAAPRPRRFISPERRLHNSIDYRDVPGSVPRPMSRTQTITSACTMTTEGISRSVPLSRTGKEVLSPGRGTLSNGDIQGSRPGPSSLQDSLQHTWGLGRAPLPSVPNLKFNNQARRTTYHRPPMYALGED